jgi:hypothetical protein
METKDVEGMLIAILLIQFFTTGLLVLLILDVSGKVDRAITYLSRAEDRLVSLKRQILRWDRELYVRIKPSKKISKILKKEKDCGVEI